MKFMKHYVILSEGEYSDYSPQYFVGDREITKEELDMTGKRIGDTVIAEWESAPTRPHIHASEWCCKWNYGVKPMVDRYNPETGEVYGSYPDAKNWIKLMEKWLFSQGYEKLPSEIPEINTSYSDFPSTRGKRSAFY